MCGEYKKYLELWQNKDFEARNKLIEHNLRLVAHIVKKYESTKIDKDDLLRKIEYIGDSLKGYTEKLVFSYADILSYSRVKKNLEKNGINYIDWSTEDMTDFARNLCEMNRKWNYTLGTCGEKIDIEQFGIVHNKCVDDDLIIRLAYQDHKLMEYMGVRIKQNNDLFGEISIGPFGQCDCHCGSKGMA